MSDPSSLALQLTRTHRIVQRAGDLFGLLLGGIARFADLQRLAAWSGLASLLDHMRQLVCQQIGIIGVIGVSQPDIRSTGEGLGRQALAERLRFWPGMQAYLAKICSKSAFHLVL